MIGGDVALHFTSLQKFITWPGGGASSRPTGGP